MFELRIVEKKKEDENEPISNRTGLFRKIIESAADIADDVDIKLSSRGLSIQFMDQMNVTMMDVLLNVPGFDKYRCDKELTLGLKIKEFLKILKGLKIDQNTIFYLQCDDDPEVLNIKFENEYCDSEYDIKLQNVGNECYEIPMINFTADAEMKCLDFLNMRKAVGNFSEYITIEACESSINF